MYEFYTDPGHGWLKVAKVELVELGIADQISRYSYMNGDDAYLEEDMDAGTFITAKNNTGAPFVVKNCITNHTDAESIIRTYRSFAA